MFEKLSQAAEQLATRVSRRQFLGRLGQRALVLAGVLGAVLASPGEADARLTGAGCPPGTHRVPCPNHRRPLCCPRGTKCSCDYFGCFCA